MDADAHTNKQYAQEILALRARVAELEAVHQAHHHRDLERIDQIERLERDQAQLEAIIASMPDAVYIGNEKGIWRTNELGIHMLGFTSAEDLHANIAQLATRIQTRYPETGERIPPDDEVFAHALRGETFVREVAVRQVQSGQELIVRSAAAPIRINDTVIGAVAINTDITAEKAADAERERLLEAEHQARMLTEAALQAREEFVAVAAHELRTPVASLTGYTRLLRQRMTRGALCTEREEQLVDILLSQTRRLERLVQCLLDLSRLQAGKLVIERKPVELISLGQQMVDEMQPFLTTQHTLHFQTSSDLIFIVGDQLRLEQVLYNLLQNALRYSPKGGAIGVDINTNPPNAYISVSDQGIGIPDNALPYIFNRFYQAENVTNLPVKRGLGLGLYIVHQIVLEHKGTLDVTSVEGKGTTMKVTLPLYTVTRISDKTVI
jgi:PAS domain S-box-containing protein